MRSMQRVVWLLTAGMLVGASRVEAQFGEAADDPAPSVEPAEPAADLFDPAPSAPETTDPAPPAPDDLNPAPEVDEANPFDPQSPGVPDSPEPAAPPYSPEPGGVPDAGDGGSSLGIQSPIDPFLPPSGMTTAPECLIPAMGFCGHQPFVYSASNCFDLASACYKYGYYDDAIALLTHAIEQQPTADYYYLRGMSQMKAGRSYEAIESADGVWDSLSAGRAGGLARVRERFNGPLAWQFRQLLDMRRPVAGGRAS